MNPCFRLTLLCSVLASVTLPAASETRIELGGELNGAFLLPEGDGPFPTVLMLHGFADDMDGAGDLYKTCAYALADAGLASFRINFRGEGDRHREDIRSTFPGRLADTVTAYKWLLEQAPVKPGQIGVLGWSLGASTAIQSGADHPGYFTSMVLWSSPSGDQSRTMQDGSMAPAYKQAKEEGMAVIESWKRITLLPEFFESFEGYDLDEALPKYPGAFLSIRGTADFLPIAEEKFAQLATGRPAETVLLAGADHIFNVFEPEASFDERVVELTVDWFGRTLE